MLQHSYSLILLLSKETNKNRILTLYIIIMALDNKVNEATDSTTQNAAEEASANNVESPTVQPETNRSGLTAEEIIDPNKIMVTLSDQATPVVVLFGPPSCGKTMTLVRLTRYLQSEGFTVNPIRTFRPGYDKHYKKMCDDFDYMINSDEAAKANNNISFMLVQVLDGTGKTICQILEAPGEYYFDPDDPGRAFPVYVHKILNSSVRKVWAIFVEPDWSDFTPRNNYVTRIRSLSTMMKPHDKTIFVFNKIDKTPYIMRNGHINTKESIRYIENLYPNIFTPFINNSPLAFFGSKYDCDFVPFQTGTYNKIMDGGVTYVEGPEEFVRNLWKTIRKRVNG